MASTLLQLLCLLQLVSLAFCITNAAVHTKDLNQDELKTDIDTQETGWIFQEKARQLEYLKNKLLSPLTVLKPPSPSYGGGYHTYTSSARIQPSYSFGISYPSYSSGWSGSNSFKKSPINYLNTFFNKGSYIQNKYNYAPDCYYQTKPTYKYPENPTYSYGTPLYYYYNTKPSVTYGTSNFGFSSQTSFTSGNSRQTKFQPSSPSGPFLVKSIIFPPANINSGPSYPLPSYPVSNSSLPSPSTTPLPLPTAPTAPEVPPSPSYTLDGTLGPKAYPGSPSWSPETYSATPVPVQSLDTSTPVSPSWSSVTPTYPSSSFQPQNPSTPSPPWSSLGSTPSVPVGQEYIVIPSSSHPDSQGQGIAVPQEVLITPSPLQKSDSIGTSPPGTKSVISGEQPAINSEPPYLISYYPNVFYISNGQYMNKPQSVQPLGNEQSNQLSLQNVGGVASPESSTSSTEEESTPPLRAEPIKSEGSIQPLLTNIYSSNTIDQTRIPVFPQGYVPTDGFTYSYVPQVVPYTNPVPYSYGFRGSLGLDQRTHLQM